MTVYQLRKEGLHWREIGGEAVVVDIPESLYLSANPTGTLLWNELAAGATRDALAALLVGRFGIELERAEGDVDRFLTTLLDRKLLEVVADA